MLQRRYSNTPAVTVMGGRWAKLQPSVFEYGKWLDAENKIVVLKERSATQTPRVGSIISKLAGMKP